MAYVMGLLAGFFFYLAALQVKANLERDGQTCQYINFALGFSEAMISKEHDHSVDGCLGQLLSEVRCRAIQTPK